MLSAWDIRLIDVITDCEDDIAATGIAVRCESFRRRNARPEV